MTAVILLVCHHQYQLRAASSPKHAAATASAALRYEKISPQQKWRSALNQLEAREVEAHIQKSLLAARHISFGAAGGFEEMNRIEFSRQLFPVTLTARAEWPPVLGGCRNLLTTQGYAAALHILKPLARAAVKDIPVLQRVLIQNALWDVFDAVYLQGSDPWLTTGRFHRRRWHALLFWLAHDMSRIAVPRKDLAGYCRPGLVRRRVLGPKLWRSAVELYSFQQATIHATALGFRRVVRIYIYDPKVDFTKLSKPQLLQYCRGQRTMGAGSVAIEVEDAIALSPHGAGLVPTRIPIIARSYRVIYAGKKNPMLAFSMFRFSRGATACRAMNLKRLPGSFGTWALLNLPTIPNGSIGYLAKYPVVCAQCHFAGELRSFRSGMTRPRARYFRIKRHGDGFVHMRTIQRKLESLDYAALQFYSSQPLPAGGRRIDKRKLPLTKRH